MPYLTEEAKQAIRDWHGRMLEPDRGMDELNTILDTLTPCGEVRPL